MDNASTFDTLIADLTKDATRAQPRDALQFCADWFNSRLHEQRARIRDIFERSPVINDAASRRVSRGHSAPEFLFRDQGRTSRLASEVRPPSMPQIVPPQKQPTSPHALGPFDEVPPSSTFSLPPHAPSASGLPSGLTTNGRRTSASSPFGTLNVSGNALNAGRPPTNGRGFGVIKEEDDGSDASSHHSMTIPNPLASRMPTASPLGFLGPPPSALGRRVSVSGESLSPSSGQERPPPFFPKTPDQLKRLEDAISDAFLFRKLDNKKRTAVLGAMKEVHFGVNEPVIVQGDDGDYFYVVDSGNLDCFKRFADDEPSPSPSQVATSDWHPKYGKKVTAYGRGGAFGELALMYYAKRAATVVTTSPCTLWALDRVTFQTILLDINAATRRSRTATSRICDGDMVVQEGEVGREFYIVEEGEAEASKLMRRNPQGVLSEEVVKHYKRGDYFGELALLNRAPRAATIRAVVKPGQPKLKVAALDADAFTRLLGPLRDLMERSATAMYQTRGS